MIVDASVLAFQSDMVTGNTAAQGQAKGSGREKVAPMAAGSGNQTPWATIGIGDGPVHWWKRGARWNDTYTGTWTTVDPITRLNDPDRANPYVYAGDNPINYTDPTGKSFLSCLGSSLAAVGGVLGFGGAVLAVLTAPETLGGSLIVAGAGFASLSADVVTLDQCF